MNKSDPFICVFIVPTKALISQFSSIYRNYRLSSDLAYDVYTSVPDGLVVETKKIVFSLTQERCIKLLSSPFRDKINFIFIDEIQKVEDKSRGALLEYVINELQRHSANSQMFFAGPYISNADKLSHSLSINVKKPIETKDSPVSQMVLLVKPVRRQKKLELTLLTENEERVGVSFSYDINRMCYSQWRNQTTAITDALEIFASNSPSIVYAPGAGTARNWAVNYASRKKLNRQPNGDLSELVEYVKESIHPQCSLVFCLAREVAFHHGKLPDFIREEIEELFSKKTVAALFCTSTLLEGVNLPADKIFIIKPSKGDEGLTPFEFRNLIGRAGRLSDHLNGVVYCVQIPCDDDKDWLNEYKVFDASPVETSVDMSFKDNFTDIQNALDNDLILLRSEDINNIRSTLTILRSRFLIDEDSAENYLKRKSISDAQRAKISESLKVSINKLVIPKELAERSPYIDPILQNKLFLVVRDSPNNWLIRRGPGFSDDFSRIFFELDKIFNIVNECRPHSHFEAQDAIIIGYAKDWLNGVSFSSIVKRALPAEYRNAIDIPHKTVDFAVQKALEYITTDVSFVTAKYFSALSEILKYMHLDIDTELYNFTIGLPVMLELGSRDPKQLSLMTACVPRSAALKISRFIPDIDNPVEWLTSNQETMNLQRLPGIYKKILKRVGIWK